MLEKKKKAVEDFFAVLPHSISLGMKIDFIRDGEVGMSMPYDKKLIGDPKTEVIHGGAVFSLLDTCCGAAAMCSHMRGFPVAIRLLRAVRKSFESAAKTCGGRYKVVWRCSDVSLRMS